MFAASYLVLNQGNINLDAPVATPLGSRQQLVMTTYNPARTWTPKRAVGIGRGQRCKFGMQGAVLRTVNASKPGGLATH
jgi:urea carboxylase/allophanate hydrolase